MIDLEVFFPTKNTGCNEKKLWLVVWYIGYEILPKLYGDYFVSQYKDPYQPITMKGCHKGSSILIGS